MLIFMIMKKGIKLTGVRYLEENGVLTYQLQNPIIEYAVDNIVEFLIVSCDAVIEHFLLSNFMMRDSGMVPNSA